MHCHKTPNKAHELGYCQACKRITPQDIYFDLQERKHLVCCQCGHVTHSQQRPR